MCLGDISGYEDDVTYLGLGNRNLEWILPTHST